MSRGILLSIVATACVLAAVGAFLGQASATQNVNPTVIAIETQIARLQAQLTAIAATPSSATPMAMPSSVHTITVDGFTITIDQGEVIGTVPIGYDEKQPRGIWVAVHFTVTNTTNTPDYFFPGEFQIVDDQGRHYEWDAYATGALTVERVAKDNQRGVGLLQPSFTYEGWIVYDVAADGHSFTLVSKSDPAFTFPF